MRARSASGNFYHYGVFLCTSHFHLAAQGGGGFKPPKPPRRSAPGHRQTEGETYTERKEDNNLLLIIQSVSEIMIHLGNFPLLKKKEL